MNLGLSWQLSSYTGWGLFGIHAVTRMIGSGKAFPVLLSDANVDSELIVDPLQRALLISVLRASEPFRRQLAPGAQLDFDVLVALVDDLQAAAPYAGRARREIGVVFLESSALSKEGRARGESQARLIAGSTWVAEVLRGHGLDRVTTVLQGVDPRLFHPAPRLGLFPGRFVVFSGGKLEYRKGQDIVLAAFRRFHQRHPDALLVASWQNLWPQHAAGIVAGGHVAGPPGVDANGQLDIGGWLAANGLPAGSFLDIGLAPNALMAPALNEIDVALFTNRCEGGTNLVAMEAMAKGVPTILSANTGHLDLIGGDTCFALTRQRPVAGLPGIATDGWGESDVDEVVETLERVYADRDEARRRGAAGAARMANLSWPTQIDRLLAEVERT